MPLHNGHLYLIESAIKQVDELIILVCSIQKEPISGELRYQWMKEAVPNAKVVHVTDEVPSYPHEHPDFWAIWTKLLKREIDPKTEVFFSSEDYGDEVAERLGIEHVLIDQQRKIVPISATEIRKKPLKNWEFIPNHVKPFFVKKIVLTGPESTGKSTLSNQLANCFDTNFVTEYGRDFFVENEGELKFNDFEKIAKGQLKLEEEAIKVSNKLLFCDTDIIVTKIWSEIYFNDSSEKLDDLIKKTNYDLYLLLDIDIPWEDDGTREFPHLRQWHFERIKRELEERKLPYAIISGEDTNRLANAINVIKSHFEVE